MSNTSRLYLRCEGKYRAVRASDLCSQTVKWDTDKYKIKYFDAEKGIIEFIEVNGNAE